ncbi:MAG TPA: hypothetical protein VMX36_09155 [Sedimentisphaerales bacterium]|nr:hypothetical protein [Sedimentisphaerales bacterium]
MCACERLPNIYSESLQTTLKKLCIVVVFSIAFGYIEAAVVVYLREIFHPDGFTFPMTVFGNDALSERLLLTEIGREAATIVLIFTGAWLFGCNRHQRFAYFMVIFAVWDIFYYIWLKVLIDWPASIMDWDILFFIPKTWASPVLYPVLISTALIVFAVVILYCSSYGRMIKPTLRDWLAFFLSGLIMVVSFCIAGLHITEQDFASYFYRSLFAAGYLFGLVIFLKCLLKSK